MLLIKSSSGTSDVFEGLDFIILTYKHELKRKLKKPIRSFDLIPLSMYLYAGYQA